VERFHRPFITTLLGFSLMALPSAQAVDYARDVAPIFSTHCLKCHGPEKQKSGYRLDQKAVALRGGDSGDAAIVISNSFASAIVQRITTTNEDEMMPPKGERLSSNEVATIRAWIDAGASWPATHNIEHPIASAHWSFQPFQRPELPRIKDLNWIRTPIDHFVLARLERERIKPSPEADRATLIRRLHLDLIGLPPTPKQVDAFVNDRQADAYERLVESLLASPHFGERWGRHWLDLARYADSAGYQIDRVRPGAYYYRDWVINSFNRDQPFDQFTIEQLAGDLLPGATMEQKIATGFHRMTLSNFEDGVDKKEFECRAKVDRVATTGTTWLGLTVGCAECHSHKFDPISQREFYQLYAFFDAAEELDVTVPNPIERGRIEQTRKLRELEKVRLEMARAEYIRVQLPRKQIEWERSVNRAALTNSVGEILAVVPGKRSAAQKRELAKFYREMDPGLAELTAKWRALRREMAQYREEQVLLLATRTNVPTTRVHLRGDFLALGEEVQPAVLALGKSEIPNLKCRIDQSLVTSTAANKEVRADRLSLARWIVAPENPLTARVAVNRIWLHLFGRGIVNTPEDFGTRGEPPSHPELLDWLASEFQRVGWSRKQIIRLIVTSATYRQSSRVRPELLERDAQNVLLARQSRFRVESEIVRDLFLSASGLLNEEIGGPGIYPPIPDDVKAAGYGVGGQWIETQGAEKYRRGLYIVNRRTVPYPIAMTFDQANPSECTARRERSNTPLQPLALLNNPVFAECSDALAKRIESARGDVKDKLSFGFETCLSREPSRAELKRLGWLWREERQNAKATEAQAWRAVADVLLNLDEFVTRE
jgi:mono/diheme cytochrome c family protein